MVKFFWKGKLGKKAIFFSFISIILLASLIFTFTIYSRYNLRTRSLVVETRVNTMNSFMKDVDLDIERGLFISSHRSILSMVEYVSANGAYIDNFNSRFEEIFMNGTINGDYQTLMSQTTFADWESKMQQQGDKINLELEFNVGNIEANQSGPWAVDVYLDVNLFARDKTDIASWNVTKSISTSVPIVGFEDPVYAVKTGGKVLNVVNQTPFSDFVSGTDTSNLQVHNTNQYYSAWSTAPSFTMRLEGNLNASPYGIESLINLQKLIDVGIEVEGRSAVDHIYWSNKSVSSYMVSNMPSWFRMDDELNSGEGMTHLELYEVQNLTI